MEPTLLPRKKNESASRYLVTEQQEADRWFSIERDVLPRWPEICQHVSDLDQVIQAEGGRVIDLIEFLFRTQCLLPAKLQTLHCSQVTQEAMRRMGENALANFERDFIRDEIARDFNTDLLQHIAMLACIDPAFLAWAQKDMNFRDLLMRNAEQHVHALTPDRMGQLRDLFSLFPETRKWAVESLDLHEKILEYHALIDGYVKPRGNKIQFVSIYTLMRTLDFTLGPVTDEQVIESYVRQVATTSSSSILSFIRLAHTNALLSADRIIPSDRGFRFQFFDTHQGTQPLPPRSIV